MIRSTPWLVAALLAATPALALDLTRTATIDAPPAKVWAAIGGFCGIGQWHPAISACTLSKHGDKPVRSLTLKGGGMIVEQQLSRSDSTMQYTYTILRSPLPVAHYTCTLAVTAEGSGSKVTWSSHFAAQGASDAKAEQVIAGIYEAGFKGLAEKTR